LATIADTLEHQRNEVFDNLRVEPTAMPTENINRAVELSVVNRGHSDIDKHTVSCTIYSIWNSKVVGFSRTDIISPEVSSEGLLGGEHGETVLCDSRVGIDAPIVCVDMRVSVNFTVAGQPTHPLNKSYRFYFDSKRSPQPWVQEPPDERTWDYCSDYLKDAEKSF
jgi:hypothetical protein